MTKIEKLYDMAKNDEIEIYNFNLPLVKSLSLQHNGSSYIAIDPSAFPDNMEKAVCLAHEMGHCDTSSFHNIHSNSHIRGRHEVRANRWAYRYLIPINDLQSAILDERITSISELAEYFNVPYDFMCSAIEYYQMLENNKNCNK